jgi:hypothetical protein
MAVLRMSCKRNKEMKSNHFILTTSRKERQSDSRGFFSPSLHNTPHAGPHGAFTPEFKGPPVNGDLQRWLRNKPPRPFHPVGCNTAVEACPSLSLPKVQAFTLSHPLRWAFGYYVTARRAVRVTVGSGGSSSASTLALSPAPMATTAPLGFDGNSDPFGPALSSTPVGTRTASGTDLPG